MRQRELGWAPCMPTIRETLPTGPRWLFEVKADGWRVQLVKDSKSLRIVSRTGKDLTAMLGPFPSSLRIPAQTAVLDGEPVTGLADFGSLRSAMAREPMSLLVFAFDLLHLDGRDFRPQPLVVRRARLGRLIARADTPALQLSHAFKDGAKLLAECERRGLEGVVAKQTDRAYRSGRADHWVKVKTASWKAASAGRGEMFASGR